MDTPNETQVKVGTRSTSQNAQSPNTDFTPNSTLTVTYCSSSKDNNETHYAVIPFPKAYEEAITVALKLLGRYMGNLRADNVILRCSAKNREGEWIWADFDPATWSLVVKPGDEVRLVQNFKWGQKSAVPTGPFWRGTIYPVCGETKVSEIKWSYFNYKIPEASGAIDRPANYHEAVELVKKCISDRIARNFSTDPAQRRVVEQGKTLTFYLFADIHLKQWIPFPSTAMTDDAVWKELVPNAGGILGVIAT
ncbi:hypothetical protein B0H11DRAFT_2250379 [Mycena galericulata]|nr:hypothetical protein B0H11DRAFT_2250379 [Mycena galericulata]